MFLPNNKKNCSEIRLQISGCGIISQKKEAPPSPTLLVAHVFARYILTRMVLEIFAFSSGSQYCIKIMSSWKTSLKVYLSRCSRTRILLDS
jgi:hypothetical protein